MDSPVSHGNAVGQCDLSFATNCSCQCSWREIRIEANCREVMRSSLSGFLYNRAFDEVEEHELRVSEGFASGEYARQREGVDSRGMVSDDTRCLYFEVALTRPSWYSAQLFRGHQETWNSQEWRIICRSMSSQKPHAMRNQLHRPISLIAHCPHKESAHIPNMKKRGLTWEPTCDGYRKLSKTAQIL